MRTSFWNDFWTGDTQYKYLFPRLYALESIKESSVADNLQAHIASSFRRAVRGGVETQQLNHFLDLHGSSLTGSLLVRIYLEEVLRLLLYLVRIAMLSPKTRPIFFQLWVGEGRDVVSLSMMESGVADLQFLLRLACLVQIG
nr:hypothetical protein [Tanacetum cinerariifolium]